MISRSVPLYTRNVRTQDAPDYDPMTARCCLGGSNHHVARPRQHHPTFSNRPQHERVCRLGRVRHRTRASHPLAPSIDYRFLLVQTHKEEGYLRHLDTETTCTT